MLYSYREASGQVPLNEAESMPCSGLLAVAGASFTCPIFDAAGLALQPHTGVPLRPLGSGSARRSASFLGGVN